LYVENDEKNNQIEFDEKTFESYFNSSNIITKKYSKDFLKKMDVFKQVINKYQTEISNDDNKNASKEETNKIVYLKKYAKTQQAIIFRLSNKIIHVYFADKTELILSTKGNVATFKGKNGEEISNTIENIMNSENQEIIKRMRYTKSLLVNFIKSKKIIYKYI